MNQIKFLKLCAHGEVVIDLAEWGERVLTSSDDYVAQAVLRIATSSDKSALWARFEASLVRICGSTWWEWSTLGDQGPLICKRTGCTELALHGICDQCLVPG